ncbi:MAG: methyltransferase domain-containing protein [Chitinivibrionales bacterium]|nr:methyltransferase domain-containing protein [Chitinivibrionales bacterium]
MDNVATDFAKLSGTLRDFTAINKIFTRSRKLIKTTIIKEMQSLPRREFTVLDAGSGGCDLALWLTAFGRKIGLKITVCCLDHDPRVVAFARERCANHADIVVRQGSVFDIESLTMPFDFIFANHLIHHLDTAEIPRLVRKFYQTARRGFLINDLHRSALAYLGFTLVAGIFFNRNFTFTDGRLSIRRGFTLAELSRILEESGLGRSVRLATAAPARIYLWCRKPVSI